MGKQKGSLTSITVRGMIWYCCQHQYAERLATDEGHGCRGIISAGMPGFCEGLGWFGRCAHYCEPGREYTWIVGFSLFVKMTGWTVGSASASALLACLLACRERVLGVRGETLSSDTPRLRVPRFRATHCITWQTPEAIVAVQCSLLLRLRRLRCRAVVGRLG